MSSMHRLIVLVSVFCLTFAASGLKDRLALAFDGSAVVAAEAVTEVAAATVGAPETNRDCCPDQVVQEESGTCSMSCSILPDVKSFSPPQRMVNLELTDSQFGVSNPPDPLKRPPRHVL